jgi:hypothetical protein
MLLTKQLPPASPHPAWSFAEDKTRKANYGAGFHFVKYPIGHFPPFLRNKPVPFVHFTAEPYTAPKDGPLTITPAGKISANGGKFAPDVGKSAPNGGKSDMDSGKSTAKLGNLAPELGKSTADLGKYSPDLGKSSATGGKSAPQLGKYNPDLGKSKPSRNKNRRPANVNH